MLCSHTYHRERLAEYRVAKDVSEVLELQCPQCKLTGKEMMGRLQSSESQLELDDTVVEVGSNRNVTPVIDPPPVPQSWGGASSNSDVLPLPPVAATAGAAALAPAEAAAAAVAPPEATPAAAASAPVEAAGDADDGVEHIAGKGKAKGKGKVKGKGARKARAMAETTTAAAADAGSNADDGATHIAGKGKSKAKGCKGKSNVHATGGSKSAAKASAEAATASAEAEASAEASAEAATASAEPLVGVGAQALAT